jgi:hypothetical protein
MKRLILFAMVIALMATGPAFGASAVQGNYGGPGGVVSNIDPQHPHHNNPPETTITTFTPSHPSSGKGSLPFTGLDLVLLALGGVALVGVGMGVRRLSRPLA